jgi:sugar/nucleoside kinase (ribokinase family)
MNQVQSTIVAGHLCLDIFPSLDHLPRGQFSTIFQPGRLVQAGAARFATGGAVANTGLAMHRLGVPTWLVAKVGDDPFGQIVRAIIANRDVRLAGGIVTDPAAMTSYTIIINPPGVDRIFLHCPGANDAFGPADVSDDLLARAALFHFGYPPIMRRMYERGGVALVDLLRRARASGATTSLDLTFPDPSSDSGRADWRGILTAALPYADLFLPSVEELLFMLRRDSYEQLTARGDLVAQLTPDLLSAVSAELLELGAKIVVIKLGDRGLYVRTGNLAAIEALGRARPADWAPWAGRELWAPCFRADVAGTTGAGDTTIAGFLNALLRGLDPYDTVTAAVAVGACSVEAPDALSGVRSWEDTLQRIAGGWERLPLQLSAPGWDWHERERLWEKRSR